MEDDCYLPWRARCIPAISQHAGLTATEGDPEPLRSGIDRPVGDVANAWQASVGASVTYTFDSPHFVTQVRIVFDSDLNRCDPSRPSGAPVKNMRNYYSLDAQPWQVPSTLTKAFTLESQTADGTWTTIHSCTNNYQRLVSVPLETETQSIRLTPTKTWGADQVRLFRFEIS
jgi:hypothetical protein